MSSKKAPRDQAEDHPPVEAPQTGQTRRPQHPFDQPEVDPWEDMDNYPTVEQMNKRLNTDISVLVQRFENIMAIAAARNDSHAATAVEGLQLDVEVTAIIRAAEDLLGLTRTMKEMWLYGKLHTVGEDERDVERREKMEADILAIYKAIEESGLRKFALGSSEEAGENPEVKPEVKAAEEAAQEPTQESSAEN